MECNLGFLQQLHRLLYHAAASPSEPNKKKTTSLQVAMHISFPLILLNSLCSF